MINPIYIIILAELVLILVFAYFFKKKIKVTNQKKKTVATYLISFLLTSFTMYLGVGVYYLSNMKF